MAALPICKCSKTGEEIAPHSLRGKPQASKQPREDEAQFVRRIFAGMAAGRDVRALCDELNEAGFLTRQNRQ